MRGVSLTALSDIHGNTYELRNLMEKRGSYTKFLFAGDGLRDMERFASHHGVDYVAVSGNCDIGCSDTPPVKLFTVSECVILLLHGHTCHVKSGIDGLISLAVLNDADIVVYGHTHEARYEFISAEELQEKYPERKCGLHLINPGSLGDPRDGDPSYAAIDICGRRSTGDAIVSVNIVRL